MERIILHCDMNNFYASVEAIFNPDLRDIPFVVAGESKERHGIVLAKNNLAKAFGVKTGDVIWQAKQKCPSLQIVPPDFNKYVKYSQLAFDLYNQYTCYVEPFGADECWLDCSGSTTLFGSPLQIANTIRRRIREELSLTASVGVSFNKIFAKLGSDLMKPDATTVIDRDNFKSRIYHLNANEMMGVGKKTYEKLLTMGIKTIGDLASFDRRVLLSVFGKIGGIIQDNALGKNYEPVRESVVPHNQKSIGHGLTASRDIITKNDAKTLILYLSDLVASRLRQNKMTASGVALCIRDLNLHFKGKQKNLAIQINTSSEISNTAYQLLLELWDMTPIRSISVSVYSLVADNTIQLNMFRDYKSQRLEEAIDTIRKKYGNDKIVRGDLIAGDFICDKNDGDFLPFKR